MTPDRDRIAAVGLAVTVGAVALVGWALTGSTVRPENAATVVACLVAIALGEVLRAGSVHGRDLAPLSLAGGSALALTPIVPERPALATAYVVGLMALVQMSAGAFLALRRRPVGAVDMAGRLLGVGSVAVVARYVPLGSATIIERQLASDRGVLAVAGFALAAGTVGALVDLGLWTLLRSRALHTTARRVVLRDFSEAGGAGAVAVTTSASIAVTAPVLGWVTVPIMVTPLLLIHLGLRRRHRVEEDREAAIRALARLTDVTGHTHPGHSGLVAEQAVALGRALGLDERELPALHTAGLLHDLGQVALDVPIPGGATVLAAPADQQRIAVASARIVSEAGGLDDAVLLLEHQATPFRQVRELGEPVPLGARILKVANAYIDLTGGSRSARIHERAMERLHLGLGYEYDPTVVNALEELRARRT